MAVKRRNMGPPAKSELTRTLADAVERREVRPRRSACCRSRVAATQGKAEAVSERSVASWQPVEGNEDLKADQDRASGGAIAAEQNDAAGLRPAASPTLESHADADADFVCIEAAAGQCGLEI